MEGATRKNSLHSPQQLASRHQSLLSPISSCCSTSLFWIFNQLFSKLHYLSCFFFQPAFLKATTTARESLLAARCVYTLSQRPFLSFFALKIKDWFFCTLGSTRGRGLCVGARSLVRLPEVVVRWVRSLHLIPTATALSEKQPQTTTGKLPGVL